MLRTSWTSASLMAMSVGFRRIICRKKIEIIGNNQRQDCKAQERVALPKAGSCAAGSKKKNNYISTKHHPHENNKTLPSHPLHYRYLHTPPPLQPPHTTPPPQHP